MIVFFFFFDLSDFSYRLKEARLRVALTQSELAKKLGVNGAAISKYETGAVQPNIESLARICSELNVSADYLLGLKDNPDIQDTMLFDEFISKYESLNETQKSRVLGYIDGILSSK